MEISQKEYQQYQSNYTDECNSALLYQVLSEREVDSRISEVYQRMSAVELKHAETWSRLAEKAGRPFQPFKPAWRTRLLIWLSKRMGSGIILSSLQAMEQTGSSSYAQQKNAGNMASDERGHSILLQQITRTLRGGMQGGALAQLEGRHRGTGNALRAAVLGANDGMVSSLSLVMGVAGATMENRAILIAGFAGLLAGAISMALGEWLSVQSSRELFAHQIKIETSEIEKAPEEEVEELALIYEARGLPPEQAHQMAAQLMSNKDSAIQTLAREELGVDPEELGGSAWEAALTSFILFAIGAIVPVFPFLFFSGVGAVIASVGFSSLGLFLLGAAITLFTGRSVLYSGFRMVLFGLAAAAITFGIGKAIGVSLG